MLEEKRVSHNGLSGRATNVFSVTSQPQVLEKIYKIANKEPDVLNLALVMMYSRAFSDPSTAIILVWKKEELGSCI